MSDQDVDGVSMEHSDEHIDVEVILKAVDDSAAVDGVEDDDDEDPGYYIVTEERATNCPSVNGNIDDEKAEKKKDGELHGKVKRWSKLLKYSMPSKTAEKDNVEIKKKSSPKDRKSLKDKMKENDFVVFLTERRAVSESRFRIMDKIGNPNHLTRTKSDQSISDDAWNHEGGDKGVKNEDDEGIDFNLQTADKNGDNKEEEFVKVEKDDKATSEIDPTEAKMVENGEQASQTQEKVADASPDIKEVSEEVVANNEPRSSGSSNSKINESSQDSSEENKKLKKGAKDCKKMEKKEKREKKKPCNVCSTPQEHKEHRKEKKRAKKERADKKEKNKAESKNHLNDDATPKKKDDKSGQSISVRSQKVSGENFFQKLLIKDDIEKVKAERPSRPRKQNKEKRPYVKTSQPSLGVFLKGKQAVTDSIFKQYDQIEKYLEEQTLPRGIIQNDDSPVRNCFQSGPLFPRSLSNLERISRKSSAERAASALSNRSESLDKRSYSLPRPNSSLSQRSDSSFLVDQIEYRNYVYEMVHSTPKSARFSQLQDYFTTLDKVVKLENAASKMEVHKLKSSDIVDFETWRQMRKKEKAKDELEYLLKDLKKAQKERDFYFRPREIDDFRWKGDSRLRGRDRSVEHLKNLFAEKEKSGDLDFSRSLPKSFAVQNGWLKLQHESKADKEPDAFASYPSNVKPSQSPYSFSNTQRSRSSLSTDQVSALKGQLNDILSNRTSNASSQQSSRSPSRHEFSIEVTDKAKPLENLFVKPVPDLVRKSLEEAEKSLQKVSNQRSKSKEDDERFKLSKTINDELMKRVNFKEEKTSENQDSKARDTSPRVCYSLESEEEKKEHNESSDFILVLSDNEEKNKQVSEIIDKWASADSEEESQRYIAKRKRSKLGAGFSSQSSDSISSGTSMHTVIYQAPKEKIDIKPIEEDDVNEDEHEKSFEEIKKNFESRCETPTPKEPTITLSLEDLTNPPNKVMEIRKSFENMPLPDPPTKEELESHESLANSITVPKVPVRTSSFNKAMGITSPAKDTSATKPLIDKDSPQSKSASSIPENLNDEGYSTFPNSPKKVNKHGTYLEKNYIPEKSISNIDLTDTENNSLDETFGKMHDKVHSLGNSNDGKSEDFTRNLSKDHVPSDPTKYSRAYLLVSKAGDVKGKLMQFEKYNGNVAKSLPAVNPEYIKSHITDTSKVVIKNHEVANVDHIKSRLEKCANKSEDIFDYCGAILTKNKLKHICKKMGHSKILSKMTSLQKTGKMEDDGFERFNIKKTAENDYLKKYQSGDVEMKRSVYERSSSGPNTEKNDKPHFRWSQRFETDMPLPSKNFNNAQKQTQFKNYYGYLPPDAPRTPKRTDSQRPASSSSNRNWESQRWGEMREQDTEEEVKRRQQQQLNQFYSTLSLHKEHQLRRDQENRKHHDTLLPNQKSPVPLDRYEDQDVNGNQAIFLNAGRKPEDCKMVARALYSFQAQNNREISFKKGDIIFVKKQVDGNWYEGERNAMVGIFPTTYVEILPSESSVNQEITRSLTRKEKTSEGEARAKFSFTAQTPMELSFLKGETVNISRKIDTNWFEGRIGNRKGIFPVSYVEVSKEPGETVKSSGSSILKSSSLSTTSYNYEKTRSGGTLSPYSTLSRPNSALSAVPTGQHGHHGQTGQHDKQEPVPYRAMYNYKPQNEDEVELCEGDVVFVMEKCDDGWFVGTSQRTGIFGTFPGNYVTQV